MRYIDIAKLQGSVNNIGWDAIRTAHLNAMAYLSVADRKEYINNHPDWNRLQPAMLNLSHNKCWYSESPIGVNDFEVDHFRPKNKAVNHDGTIIKQNGYWWKAYDWENYRLTGGLANKRRRDRLKDTDDVKGKGSYFPLDLVNGTVANDEAPIGCEVVILLDPTRLYDVSLISFNAKGEVTPATVDDYEINRVKLSVNYYHLDLDQLEKDRKIAWDDCVNEIQDAKKAIDEGVGIQARQNIMEMCFRRLKRLVDETEKPYTCVRKACLQVYSEKTGYSWLKELIKHL
jgi:hypothetical protein